MADTSDAYTSGDRLAGLEALRDDLAEEFARERHSGFCDQCKRSSSTLAPLAAQLRAVLAEIAEVKAAQPDTEGTPLDALRQRREARKSGAPRRARSGPGVDAG